MKRFISQVWGTYRSVFLGLALIALLVVPLYWLDLQPSYAASAKPELSNENPVDRAYEEFSLEAGIQEEIYQERLKQGEDPEKMPGPFKRVPSLADSSKEVPETSAVETTISRVRELVEDVTK
ncbi:MAG TPA: hypothetical protein V6D29_05360 [Leptolyngbyaceae cyanobacterium]